MIANGPKVVASVAVFGLLSLLAALTASPAHAGPWEPIRTTFDYDDAAFRKGTLVLPTFGMVAPELGDKSQTSKTGYRMGALLGWHLSPRLSLNGEVNLSLLRFDAGASGGQADTGLLFDYGLAPLFHIGARNLEVVLGPKLGRFRYSLPDNENGEQALASSSGWSYGANFGVFAPVWTMAVGGLVSYTANHATEICDSSCHARTSTGGDLHVIAISFAMLY